METLKKFVRSIQVFFPFVQDYRFTFQRVMRRLLNKTHELDFEALALLDAKDKLFLDIGTNRGEAIQSILMRVPSADIIGFEPNPIIHAKTTKVFPQVKIFNFGLGNQLLSGSLYVPFYNNYMFDGLASFKENEARDFLETRLFFYNKKKLELKKANCEIRRLDDLALNPFFMKIDVQGFEYEVLMGAQKTLDQNKPILLIEAAQPNLIEFLTGIGYGTYYFDGKEFKPGVGVLNTFFIHPQKQSMIRQKLPEVTSSARKPVAAF